MSVSQSPSLIHNLNTALAEGLKQSAIAVAGGNMAAVRSAEVQFHQTCRSSALANGVSPSVHIWALKSLGQTG
jgi:hypothetical protein